MHSDEQNQSRIVDKHTNQDKVWKESLSLFTGGSLEFLHEELSGEVTDILSTEITETTTKKPSVTSYASPCLTFTPKIINLKERDADKVLAEIDRKLNAGEHGKVNILEIIYLPLYGSESGKTTLELLDTAIKLTPKVSADKHTQHKLQDLLILLTSTFISDEERNKIWEANMRILEDNPAVKWLEDRGRTGGRNQEKIEIAINMLRDGDDAPKVSRITGLDIVKVAELQTELQAHAV